MKKILSLITAAALTLSSISVVSSAQTSQTVESAAEEVQQETLEISALSAGDSFVDGDFKYTELEDGTLEVLCNNKKIIQAEIPATVNGRSVTSIGDSTFLGCSRLTSVKKPSSVTNISRWAFMGCTSLTSVTIPNSVTNIGNMAFQRCTNLTSITISNSVISIGNGAFDDCSSLTSVTIPSSVTSIGDEAFRGCTGLTSITIPNSVTSIGSAAFRGCTSLTSVTIPDSVTSIYGTAFSDCTSLTAINVDSQNKNYCAVNGVLFNKDKTELLKYPSGKTGKSYTIPNSVTSIRGGAFRDCSSLTSVTIPDSVTSIGNSAFAYCYKLTSVTIPNSVTSIDNFAFNGCNNLKNVYYTGFENEWDKISIGSRNDPLRNAIIHYNSTGPTGTPVDITINAPDKTDVSEQTATVTVHGETKTLTIVDGLLDVSALEPGTYTITFSANNCAPRSYTVTISDGTATGLDKVELNLYGDINGDGKLTLSDVLKANAAARNSKPLTGYEANVADINNDGNISLSDVLKMNAHARNSKLLW